jgi:Spy/CpxP family protein refolding chaperone
MKTFITIFLSGLFLMQPALAEMADKDCYKDRFIKDMQLNDDQVDAVKQIMKGKREKRRAIMDEMRPKIDALHNETREQLATVLNEEQLSKFDELLEKKRKKREERKSRRNND